MPCKSPRGGARVLRLAHGDEASGVIEASARVSTLAVSCGIIASDGWHSARRNIGARKYVPKQYRLL